MNLNTNTKWPVFFLTIVILIDFMGMATVVVLFPKLLIASNSIFPEIASTSQRLLWLGLLLAIYPAGQIAGASVFGKLSDYYGRKKLLIATLIGTLLGFAMSGFAIELGSLFLLFVGRLVAGVFAGNVAIAQASLVDLSTEKTKAKNIAFGQMAMGAAYIVGPIFGAVLSESATVSWFNSATPFWFFSLILVTLIIVTATCFKETIKERKKEKIELLVSIKEIYTALTDKSLGNTFFAWLLFVSGWWLFESFMPAFLLQNFHFSTIQIGNVLAFNGALYASFQYLIVQKVAKNIRPENMIKYSGIFVSLSIIALVTTSNTYQLYITMAIFVMSMGFMIPGLITYISNQAGARDQGQVMGMVNSIQAVSTVVVMVLGGYMNSISNNFTIVGGGILVLLSWVYFIVTYTQKAKSNVLLSTIE